MFSRIKAIFPAGSRSIYKRPSAPIPNWLKVDVNNRVLEQLYEYANVAQDKVSLDAKFERGLLIGERERVSLFFDLCKIFHIKGSDDTLAVKYFKSGKEAAEWVAAKLEKAGRLEKK